MKFEDKLNRIQISLPSFSSEEFEAIKEPLQSGWITQGKFVKEFEDRFAEIHQVKYAIATTSCTTALHLMLLAGGIEPGDEVILPSFTWIATANAILYCGGIPIFVDIDLESFNIDIDDILKKITKKTKAILVVHLFGRCVDVEEIKKHVPENIKIFEDAACATGASIGGKMAGSLGNAASFSFHPRKSITTGEGGMLTTNDSKIAMTALKMRNHGAEISEEERHNGPAPYLLPDFNILGFNYRMTDLQGAVGVEQLKKLEKFIAEREAQAAYYSATLSDVNWLSLPTKPLNSRHAWQAYVMRVNHPDGKKFRNEVMQFLHNQGIASRPGTHAIHTLNFYRTHLKKNYSDHPNSQIAQDTTIAIPLHNKLTEEEQSRIQNTLHQFRY